MNGSDSGVKTIQGNGSNAIGRVWPSQVLGQLQRAAINFDVFGLTNGALMNLELLISFLHQPTGNNVNRRYGHMKTTMPIRVRVLRFIDERYVQREQPPYFAELALFGMIVVIAVWPILSLAAAMETLR